MTSLLEIALINAAMATVLAVAVWLATRVWHHPALAHALWIVVLVKLITPPMVAIPWRIVAATSIDHAPARLIGPPAAIEVEVGRAPLADQSVAPAAIMPETPATLQLAQRADGVPDRFATHLSGSESPRNVRASTLPNESLPWQSIVIAAWVAGSTIVLMVSVVRLARFHRALASAAPAPPEIEQLAHELATQLGVADRYRLRTSSARLSPLLWPVGRPTILVPRGLVEELSREELSTLLAHELAHLRRRDHWVRWLELLVATVYWWHPVVWWARVAIRQSEEAACDAWVVWAFPNANAPYASALFKAVQFVTEPRSVVPLMASALGSGGDLKERIENVMNATWKPRLRMSVRVCLLCVVAAILPISLQAIGSEEPVASVENSAEATEESATAAEADVIVDGESSDASPSNAPGADNGRSADASTQSDPDPVPSPYSAPRNQRELEIERALSISVHVRFVETPLEDVLKAFSDTTNIDIHLDPLGLSQEGQRADTPVTIELNKTISLKSALNLILEPLHLTFAVEDEVLKITSDRAASTVPTQSNIRQRSHRIQPGDTVHVWVHGALADAPIKDEFIVEPAGTVALGPIYGRVKIAGFNFQTAEDAITEQLSGTLKDAKVQVTLGRRRDDAPATSANPLSFQHNADEVEALREHLKFAEDHFNQVDARYRTGSAGGSAADRSMTAYELATARGQLAIAEGDRDQAITHFEEAEKNAEAAVKAVEAAYGAGTATQDLLLKAAKNLAESKRRLIQARGQANPFARAATEPPNNPASSFRNSNLSVSAPAVTESIGVLKKIVERAQHDYSRMEQLAENKTISAAELAKAKTEYEISFERLRQGERALKFHRAQLAIAESDYGQLVEANERARGAVTQSELRRAKLLVELAQAKLEELSE